MLINGQNYAWSDLAWIIFGNIPMVGITEIDYKRDRESVNNYGAGNEPVSYGYKNFTYSGSISIYVDELRAILSTAPNKSILEIPPSNATVTFGVSGGAVPVSKDVIKNIRFTSDPFSSKQNDSAIIVKIPFVFAGLEHDI